MHLSISIHLTLISVSVELGRISDCRPHGDAHDLAKEAADSKFLGKGDFIKIGGVRFAVVFRIRRVLERTDPVRVLQGILVADGSRRNQILDGLSIVKQDGKRYAIIGCWPANIIFLSIVDPAVVIGD